MHIIRIYNFGFYYNNLGLESEPEEQINTYSFFSSQDPIQNRTWTQTIVKKKKKSG
jgi:hypothetical protein